MARKQIGQNEFDVQAVAEARVVIQTMATTGMARQENAGIEMSRPLRNNQHSIGEQMTNMKSCKTLNLK